MCCPLPRGTCRSSGATCSTSVSDWCTICHNGGTCIETVFGIMCQCPRFWTGTQCKEQITCRNLPCKQASACHDYVSAISWYFALRIIHVLYVCVSFYTWNILSAFFASFSLLVLSPNSLEAIIAPANQDGQDQSVPLTWMNALAILAEMVVYASINSTVITANVWLVTLVQSLFVFFFINILCSHWSITLFHIKY